MSDQNGSQKRLIIELGSLWKSSQDQPLIEKTILGLEERYNLSGKMTREPEVGDILKQMAERLAKAYPRLSAVQNKRILDIACGSNSSKLPASFFLSSLFGGRTIRPNRGYTALFEPWFCRMLLELGAEPVGIDFGDLEGEVFIHHHVDLGVIGALDFLPDHSFDGIQDSRLFGSPEFTAQFRDPADRLKVAGEIVLQEQRLLKTEGILIHSDATGLMK